ncbi:hypothetical protein B2J93_1547 [Marssonina coronariae]|uniref:THIF-type NAD/FAD binding fold domain-containing protein n=1 Tax=Diplocarpon coronariae TaxID=2795749 RepID=A0A218Z490_9HELO|nr:hypothetical protein B2J93_1547 [Marssonina coronariae]
MSSKFRSLWPAIGTIISSSYTAEFFDATNASDRAKLDDLVASGAITTIHDSTNDQLEELVEGRAPRVRLQEDALRQCVLAHLGTVPVEHYGTYVFLPWRKELLHILPRDEFLEVRTSRNRYKITAAEQKRLSEMRVGIVGLSVGSATALNLALEGICGELRIADFDVLSLSNTNRLRSPISNIGVNKAVLCAREVCEINPYLRVVVYPAGLNEDNLEGFLCDGGKLDLLIEECDDIVMKLFARERARCHGIPVIMETSDRGLLDIERFDREPNRPLFHNLMGDGVDSSKIKSLSPKERMPYQVRIVGTRDTVSPRLLASLFEMGKTIKSFPQLASAISLGAGIAADTARRLLLGEALPSGQFHVDLTKLVSAEALAALPDWKILEATGISQSESNIAVEIPLVPRNVLTGPLHPIEAEFIVAHGCLAPSGGNSQAWHFTSRDGRLDCSIPSNYSWTNLDFEGRSLYVAMGAAVENITLAARAIGLRAQVLPAVRSGPREVCSINFERAAPVQDPLFAAIPKRITNRQPADLEKCLADTKLQALVDTASRRGAQLRIVTDEAEKRKVAGVIGVVDRVRYLHQGLHSDMSSEVRWTREHAHATCTGIGIDTLGLDTPDRLGAYLITSWPTMEVLRDLDLGSDLERPGRETRCHAFALLTMARTGLQAYLEGGRAMQQVWLEATLQDIGLCPSSSSPFMFARLEHGGDAIYSEAEKQALRAARRDFLDVFPEAEMTTEILLFRLSEAAAPTARSLRRPVSQVLTIIDK